MTTRLMTCLLGAAVLATAACSVPITTPEQTLTVPYSTFVPNIANGVPLVTGLPPFADQAAPAVNFPTPAEAKKVKLESVMLHLRMRNTGPLPLRVTLYLTKHPDDPYATPPLGGAEGTLEVPGGGGQAEKAFPLDPALLQNEQLRLGYKFGSPGTTESVTFKDTDKVEVSYKVSVAAKLF